VPSTTLCGPATARQTAWRLAELTQINYTFLWDINQTQEHAFVNSKPEFSSPIKRLGTQIRVYPKPSAHTQEPVQSSAIESYEALSERHCDLTRGTRDKSQ